MWLIEQWTGAKPPVNIQPLLYKFAISSMERNFDIAVRLAASSALRQVMDDFEFDLSEKRFLVLFLGWFSLRVDSRRSAKKFLLLYLVLSAERARSAHKT